MKIAVIILHFGKIETTKKCLTQLSKKIGDNQVILVNNTSSDIGALVGIIKGTKFINNDKNLGFAAGVNQGIVLANRDSSITHYFLMNNDLEITQGSLNQLALTFNKHETAGIVSPVLHHQGGYDWGGRYNKWTGMVNHKNWVNKPKTIQTVEHVAGAAMLIKKSVIDKIGMFDERFFLYYEDLDFCLRAKQAGFTIHINPEVVAEHAISSGSSAVGRTKYQWHSHLQFVSKHVGKFVYPSAYLYDVLFYPLVLLKLSLRGGK